MTPPDFTTARLSVRDWRPALADPAARRALEAALAGLLTPPVLAPLPPALQLDPAPGAVAAWVQDRAAEAEVMTVAAADGGGLVGLLLLAADPDPAPAADPALHLGYLLAETAWGRGLATELLAGLVAALSGRGPLRLRAGVDRTNPASARVLVKAGFVALPELSAAGAAMFERRVG